MHASRERDLRLAVRELEFLQRLSQSAASMLGSALRALLASVEAEERSIEGRKRVKDEWVAPPRIRRRPRRALPGRIDTSTESLDRGLAQLVLVLVDVLREVMERQAIRRLRAGSLDPDEVERLSEAFAALDDRLERMCLEFGLDSEPDALASLPAGSLSVS